MLFQDLGAQSLNIPSHRDKGVMLRKASGRYWWPLGVRRELLARAAEGKRQNWSWRDNWKPEEVESWVREEGQTGEKGMTVDIG